MPFYVDSAEEPLTYGTASKTWEFEVDARDEAIRLAKANPDTEYYVNQTVMTSRVTYRALASVELTTQEV